MEDRQEKTHRISQQNSKNCCNEQNEKLRNEHFSSSQGVGLDKRCEYVYDEHKNEENYELKIKAIK